MHLLYTQETFVWHMHMFGYLKVQTTKGINPGKEAEKKPVGGAPDFLQILQNLMWSEICQSAL